MGGKHDSNFYRADTLTDARVFVEAPRCFKFQDLRSSDKPRFVQNKLASHNRAADEHYI